VDLLNSLRQDPETAPILGVLLQVEADHTAVLHLLSPAQSAEHLHLLRIAFLPISGIAGLNLGLRWEEDVEEVLVEKRVARHDQYHVVILATRYLLLSKLTFPDLKSLFGEVFDARQALLLTTSCYPRTLKYSATSTS